MLQMSGISDNVQFSERNAKKFIFKKDFILGFCYEISFKQL
jgi:hypothetical protein